MERVEITIKPYTSEEECAKANASAAALLARVDDTKKKANPARQAAPRPMVPKKPVERKRDKDKLMPRSSGDEWILVVDDNAELLDVCRQMLEHLGYNVISAMSSEEALEIFRTHAGIIDLVISDVEMPGMSGTELTTELLAIRPGMPILLYSGYNGDVRINHALAVGASDFRLKPMPMSEMATCVRNLIDKAA
jgi:CheY-like chemotaxis protein